MVNERVGFEEVISDPKLMGKLWKELSLPQQVCLKAAYGLPLESDAELVIWSVLNDSCSYDELYYPHSVKLVDYTPQEYRTIVGCIGRRSGKSHITCFGTTYEIIFGGHHLYAGQKQELIVPYIAQDLSTAKANMAPIAHFCQSVPMLAKQIKNVRPDKIEFVNGITVVPEPPAIKTGRGFAMPVVIMDEVGFWYKTSDNANPDFEVQRAVNPSQLQFPDKKQFIISSPYTQEGLLWKYNQAGTKGRNLSVDKRGQYENTLVLQASTAAMENPRLVKFMKSALQQEHDTDPESFAREYGARFSAGVSGFISKELLASAISPNVTLRSRTEIESTGLVPAYVAAMDPAFRHDDWAFTIMHRDMSGAVVQDLLIVWRPDKKLGIKNDPEMVMSEIAATCKAWNISVIYSDQYQLESLQQIAMTHGVVIQGVDITGRSKAKIFGSLTYLLRQKQLKLLDHIDVIDQLGQLQKKLTAMGQVQISAPNGKRDDVAMVVALGAAKAIELHPHVVTKPKEKSFHEQVRDQIKRQTKEKREEEYA